MIDSTLLVTIALAITFGNILTAVIRTAVDYVTYRIIKNRTDSTIVDIEDLVSRLTSVREENKEPVS